MDSTNARCFAPCPRGLELLLEQELKQFNIRTTGRTEGGVAFSGSLEALYTANLESRIASRILLEVAHVPYRTEQDVYAAALQLPWQQWFSPERSMKVKVSARQCPLKSLDFVTLRIKDAVCDKFMQVRHTRPGINTHQPDIRIDAFLDATHLTLYLDTSGEPLFKRGFRKATVDAPLRENLAAGILKLTGWTADQPLLDPLCGSATIPLEAALMARKIAPGLGRHFAFEKLLNFDRPLWTRLTEQSRSAQLPKSPVPIVASDNDPRSIRIAQEHLRLAGVEQDIQLTRQDLFDVMPPQGPGIVVMNPPYGVRLSTQEDLAEFYPPLGQWMKQRCVGWHVYLFTGDLRAPKLIGLAPSKRTPLFNGALECRLYAFPIVQGSMRRTPANQGGNTDSANP